ncbi:MAG: hypothetical protein CBD16_00365 [Betaproteobacteria bacterium TMED156]|nr:MAG: hypothetical protein CBD16_00365 [Betaproteobacteria bacterium TMED156]
MKNINIQFIGSSRFEAARSVEILPKGHKSRNLHGHSFWASIISQSKDNYSLLGTEHTKLKKTLENVTEHLDYAHLNRIIKIPTDANLAKWVKDECKSLLQKNIQITGLQSTKDQGVHLGSDDNLHVWKRFQFEAAHKLPNVEKDHKCGRMHGHSFRVIIHASVHLKSQNLLADYEQLSKIWMPIDNLLNYSCLNEIQGLSNPTSELLAKWIWEKILPNLPCVSCVSVYETESCGAHFDGKKFKIWKDFTIDSAIKFDSPDVKIGSLHGHTFLLRLNLSSSLNKVMGWTKDFGDVKELFRPIFNLLDHHPLHENIDIENKSLLGIAKWILKNTQTVLPEVSGIEFYETEGSGVILKNNFVGPAMPLTQK